MKFSISLFLFMCIFSITKSQSLTSSATSTVSIYTNMTEDVTGPMNDGFVTSEEKVVIIGRDRLIVPQVVTPNNDGHHDFFSIESANYLNTEMFIFDQWGNLVFETVNVTKGWDAKKEGQPIRRDTYIYVLKLTDLNGKVHRLSGSVNVK